MATTNAVKPTNQQAQASDYEAAQGTAQGYIAQASDASGYEGAQGSSSNYSADQREVGSNSTVKGQMEGLLSEGSKYLDIARQNSAQQANKRGFLNSTMAAGAGERAAIEAAMPIATQDASTYNNQSLTNQAASNQSRQYNAGNDQQMTLANMDSTNTADRFTAGQEQQNSQFNAQSQNQAGQFNAQQDNAMSQFNAESENVAGQFNAQSDQRASEFNAQQANQMLQEQWSQESAQAHESTMAGLNASLEQGIIDSKAYANMRGQYLDSFTSLVNEANINISEIQSNAEIPAAEKEKMISQQMQMRDADLTALKELYNAMPMWQQHWNAAA